MDDEVHMSCRWNLTLYKSWTEVDDPAFIARWQEWMDCSPDAHVFFHPALVKAWTDTYRKVRDISPMYCVAEADGVVVFLPLVLWKRNWKNAFLRMLVPAGYSDYDYHDPIVTATVTKEFMGSFWQMLEERLYKVEAKHYDRLEIIGIRGHEMSDGYWQKSSEQSFYNVLTGYSSYKEFISGIPKSLRQDIGRRKRRLAEEGALFYKVHSTDETQNALLELDAMLEAHRKRRPLSYKASGFHHALMKNGLPSNLIHFSVLTLNGKAISWRLGFQYKKHFYSYMPAFLNKFSRFSPSKVHLAYTIEDAFKSGIRIFDHLRGAHGYKNEWMTQSLDLYSYSFDSNKTMSILRLQMAGYLRKMKA